MTGVGDGLGTAGDTADAEWLGVAAEDEEVALDCAAVPSVLQAVSTMSVTTAVASPPLVLMVTATQ